jgi:hypothetical protein
MDPLPMAPSCGLDEAGLRSQLARYRAAGAGARVLSRETRRLVLEVDSGVDAATLEQLVAVERECCPFFEIDWEPARRRLSVGVSESEHEPALEAVAFALGAATP